MDFVVEMALFTLAAGASILMVLCGVALLAREYFGSSIETDNLTINTAGAKKEKKEEAKKNDKN